MAAASSSVETILWPVTSRLTAPLSGTTNPSNFHMTPEDVSHQKFVGGAGHPVEGVVDGHDRLRLPFHDAGLEVRQPELDTAIRSSTVAERLCRDFSWLLTA